MEEIVKVISIDTRKSERSIKDLKNDIKALKRELESTTIGSKDFDLKIAQLGKLQQEYKAINEEIVNSSKPVKQQMFELARFGENLAKSYSAINAAMGLLSDGNEDVQKALLKTAQVIQLIQGLSGFAPLLKQIPTLADKFKGLLKWLDPVNQRINNIASKLIGFDVNKLSQLNGSGPGSVAGGQGGANINAENEALAKQTTTYYPALLDQRKKLLKTLEEQLQNYEVELDYLKQMKQFTTDWGEAWAATKDISADFTDHLEQTKKYLKDIKGYTAEEIQENWRTVGKDFKNTSTAVAEMEKSISKTKETMSTLEKEIALAEVGMSKFAKVLFRIPVLGKAVQVALIGIKAALASIGIGLIIQLFAWLLSLLPKLKNQTRALNQEIDKGAASISAKSIVAFKELAKRYRELGDSAEKKKQFLVDFRKEIEETGLAINNINDADNAFINNTEAYIQALKDRAKAQAIENEAVRIYQEYLEKRAKKENTRRGERKRKDRQLAQDLVGAGVMTQEEADQVGQFKKLQKKEKEVEATLDRLFEEMFELEKRSKPYFAEVSEGAADAAKEAAEAKAEELKTLEQYYKDARRLFMDARTRELEEIREKYDEQIALAKKHNKDTTLLEQARQREIDEVIKKYNDERLAKLQEDAEEQYQVIQDQIDAIRAYAEYEATVRDKGKGATDNWTYYNGGLHKYKTNQNIKDDYKNTIADNDWELQHLEQRLETENALLQKQLEIEMLSAEKKMAIQQQIADNEKALIDATTEHTKKNQEAKQKMLEEYATTVTASFETASNLIGGFADLTGAILEKQMKEDEAAGDAQYTRARKTFEWYKGFQIAQAIINTFSSAISAYNSAAATPVVGPYLAPIAAAGAIASGIANVMTIKQQQFEGGVSSSISSASVSAPAALSTPPIEYTRNLLGNKETDELNKPMKVYVLESEITDVQNRVRVTENNASF